MTSAPPRTSMRRAFILVASIVGATGIAGGLLAPAAVADEPAAAVLTPGTNVDPSDVLLPDPDPWSGPTTITTPDVAPKMDIMFVVDHTGSMSSFIAWVAGGIGDTAAALAARGAEDIQWGVMSYGDEHEACTTTPPYMTELAFGANTPTQVTDTLNAVSTRVGAGAYCSGGDTPESSLGATLHAGTETAWRTDARHYLVVLTDAPFRTDDASVAGYPATTAGIASMLADKDLYLNWQMVLGATNQAEITSIGSRAQWTSSNSRNALTANLLAQLVGLASDWTVTHTTTCTYPDGSPSTDLDVTTTPASQTAVKGSTITFTTADTPSLTPARYGVETTCTVQYYFDGASGGDTYRQTHRYTPDDRGLVLSVVALDAAPGTTLTPAAGTMTPGVAAEEPFRYIVTATNSSTLPITGASFSNDLSGVLDEATMVGTPVASTGTATMSADGMTLSWTGDLAGGASATVEYSVRVDLDDPNDHALVNTVSSAARASNCPTTGTRGATCASTLPVAELRLENAFDKTNVRAGDTITYTVTATNVGSIDYANATFHDDLAAVMKHVDFAAPTAKAGTATLTGTDLTWTGPLATSASTTITLTGTVKAGRSADASVNVLVDTALLGANCRTAPSSDPRCVATLAAAADPMLPITGAPVGMLIALSGIALVVGGLTFVARGRRLALR